MEQQDASGVASAVVRAAPPVASNLWLWTTSHDINWYVAVMTMLYIGLQIYVLIRDKVLRKKHGGK